MNQNAEDPIRKKLEAEVDTVPWPALMRHFAFGRVYVVHAPWDLLDAALALHRDEKETVQEAIRQKRLEKPTDEVVQGWLQSDAPFDMLIISPFVLIQAKENRQRGSIG